MSFFSLGKRILKWHQIPTSCLPSLLALGRRPGPNAPVGGEGGSDITPPMCATMLHTLTRLAYRTPRDGAAALRMA